MHRYPVLRFVFICLLLPVFQLHAQDAPSLQGSGIEANFLAGKIIKHTVKFKAPIPPISTALDMNILWQTYGKKEWHQRRHFPLLGVGITYTDYGNNQVFGNSVGIYPNLQIPIIRGKKIEWTFRIGDGLAYVTRKNQVTAPVDTINNAIGSHLDDFAVFMMDLRYHLDDHWQLQLGGNFTHISNADYHQPNLGVNMAGGHIGLQYFPVTSRPQRKVKELPRLPNRWLLEMRAGISYKEARATGNPILPTYMGSLYVSRRWLGKNKYYFGADYAFHNDVLAFLETYCDNLNNKKNRSWDGAVFTGNEFMVGRVGIMTQIGAYYKQTYLKFDYIYEKLGGNLYLLKAEHGTVKELFISAMLLTHSTTAELAEFGLGVGI